VSRLSRNIVTNLVANGWATVLSLLLTPLYLAYLGVEGYALVGFYLSLTAIVSIVDTAVATTALREMAWLAARPAERGQIPSLIRSLETAYWGLLVVVGLALLAAAWSVGTTWFQASAVAPAIVQQALLLMAVSLVVQVPSGL